MQIFQNFKENLKLENLVLIIPCIFGLFHTYAVFAVTIFFLVIIFIDLIKNKSIKIYFNYCFIAILILLISSGLACIWAIDRFDALIGFCRILSVFILSIILMQKEDKEKYYSLIPETGVLMVLICFIVRLIPLVSQYFYNENGRLSGFFQYSNTFALFLLIGIIVLIHKENKYILQKVFILLIGIFLTGSRTVFLLTLLVFLIYFLDNKNKQRFKILMMLITLIGISALIAFITGNFNTIGRYLTISLNSSTLWGRIIYYKDALKLIKQNIFGYGYMGYSYIYPTIQTANYSVKFVHNEFLQIALDYGIFAMLAIITLFTYSIFSKKINKTQRIVLIVIFLHALIDFDLQFMIIFYIVILMADFSKYGKKEICINRSVVILGLNCLLIFMYLYLAIANFMYYINQNDIALNMISTYTEAKKELLINEENLKEANQLSNEILKENKYIKQTYDVKSIYELNNNNYEKACEYKENSIKLNKYDSEEYEDYVIILSKILDKTIKSNDDVNTEKYIKKVLEIENMVKTTNENTSRFAEKIKDKSKIELNDQTLKYIENIKGVVEK